MTRKRVGRIGWLVLVFLAVAGVGLLVYAQSGRHGGPAAAKRKAELGYIRAAQADTKASVSLETAPVETVRQRATLRVTGTLVADEESDVSSNASGMVTAVLVERGSVVRQGDVLVRLDPTDAQNTLDEGIAMAKELQIRLGIQRPEDPFDPQAMPEVKLAEAAQRLAAANFKRAEALYARKVTSTEEYDRTLAERDSARYRYETALRAARQLYQNLDQALVRLKTLRKAVDDTTIVAPFDGWVAEKKVAVGERIQTAGPNGSAVVKLIRLDPLRLSLTVPQQHVGQIAVGQTVEFQVDAFPDRQFTGEVRYIAPAVTDAGRALMVEAVVPNAARALRPGLFATARLELNEETTEIYLPAAAVRREGDVGRVFVVRQGVAREQVVSVVPAGPERFQVLTGLDPQDVVVLNPEKAADGLAVR